MIAPLFYVRPGDEQFVPQVSHPHEDAGADIRAHVRDEYDRDVAIDFYREFESDTLLHGTRLYIDGEIFTSESESDFLTILDECDGGVLLAPGDTVLVSSGFKIILPNLKNLNFPWSSLLPVYKIVPRSGLAHKHRIVVTNSPGIIDAGYQDWVRVSLTNNGDSYHVFTHGSRIAQGLCEMVFDQTGSQSTTNESVFNVTGRTTGGFGSTGV